MFYRNNNKNNLLLHLQVVRLYFVLLNTQMINPFVCFVNLVKFT